MRSAFKKLYVEANFSLILCFVKITVEPRFNEPLYNEVLGITNDIFQPSNSVMR